MDYDYRNRPIRGGAASFYPQVSQPPTPPAARAPYRAAPPPPSSGVGIRVAIKPEYRISPPPSLVPQIAEVPRSTFQFNFDFEKKILAEAEQGSQNWSRIAVENQPPKTDQGSQNWSRIAAENQPPKTAAPSSTGPVGDPVVNKYVASGLGREAVALAVLNYGDNPTKVTEFVKAYNLLREMGFSSKNVAESLAMYDNDTEKALAHFLNNSS